ncbi:hypothetical protein B296_00041405 [Ensete ventricosum]|uniref:Uncharacterized protein n=1 Tax=Ensete ventricosum TaxID=4639 RepID=A0A426ZGR3_ENSVE|nr:hypothetical protein B296_00041405 [Ensete ventricosum]
MSGDARCAPGFEDLVTCRPRSTCLLDEERVFRVVDETGELGVSRIIYARRVALSRLDPIRPNRAAFSGIVLRTIYRAEIRWVNRLKTIKNP